MAEIRTILQVVSQGSRLSLQLHEVGATVSSATADVTRLAKEISLLAFVLRQTGTSLHKEYKIPSAEAVQTVGEITKQCLGLFNEVDALVQVGSARDPGTGNDEGTPLSPWRWNRLQQTQAAYLLDHIESLRLTLSAMLQTFYVVKALAQLRQKRSQLSFEAVDTERLQLQGLIIEQQMSLFRSRRKYEEYRDILDSMSASELSIGGIDPHVIGLAVERSGSPTPKSLMPYHDKSLTAADPSAPEKDQLAMVRRISSPHIDFLLSRWTLWSNIEEEWYRQENDPDARQRRDSDRSYKRPSVDSEEESDGEEWSNKRNSLPPSASGGPVLMHVDELSKGESNRSPKHHSIPVPNLRLRPPGRPQSLSSSWSPHQGQHFPNSPLSSAGSVKSAGYNPGSPASPYYPSPRASASSVDQPFRPVTAFKTGAPEKKTSPKTGVPWRLRLLNYYWDYEGDKIIRSSALGTPQEAAKDKRARTEILEYWVCKEAIEEAGLQYSKIAQECQGSGKTTFEPCFCIEAPLTPARIEALVERTNNTHRRRSSRDSVGPDKPRLDRSQTAPLPPPTSSTVAARYRPSDSTTRRPHHASRSNASTTSDSDTPPRTQSRSRRDPSMSNASAQRRRSGTGSTLTKIAVGTGLATLLDGLADGLGNL